VIGVTTRVLCTGVCLLGLSALAAAQGGSQDAQSFDYSNTDLKPALAEIGKLYGVKVLGEEGLKGSVTAKATNAPIETALTMIAVPNGLAWRKFVLAAKPTDNVTAETLGDLMAALETIRFSGLLMQGPEPGGAVIVERAAPTEDLIGTTAPDGAEYTAYYYVYDPTPKPVEAKSATEKRPGRVFGMPDNPQQQMTVYRDWFAGLDVETKRQLMKDFMREMIESEGAIMLDVEGVGPGGPGDVHRRAVIRVRTGPEDE
jgi:hypothetical protein